MIVNVQSSIADKTHKELFTKDFLHALGVEVKNRIVSRTQAGLDKDREKFKPYSKNYKSFRKRHGRKSNIVDLTMTGAMLDNLDVQSSNEKIRIKFSSKKEFDKARFISKEGNVQRKFLGLHSDDRTYIKNKIEDFILKNIRKAGL